MILICKILKFIFINNNFNQILIHNLILTNKAFRSADPIFLCTENDFTPILMERMYKFMSHWKSFTVLKICF